MFSVGYYFGIALRMREGRSRSSGLRPSTIGGRPTCVPTANAVSGFRWTGRATAAAAVIVERAALFPPE